jgi:hypothetical protein
MINGKLLFAFILACGSCVFATQAISQPACQTAESIEKLNQGALKRMAHIKGDKAIVYIALDPVWSAPEFKYEGYRDEHFIAAMKRMRESLVNAGIDEVVVWQLSRAPMGVAVPFKNGCAVMGYGEPDYLDKLVLMHETFLVISKHGLDDPLTRESIKKLLMNSRYASNFNEGMIDTVIANLRPLVKKKTTK